MREAKMQKAQDTDNERLEEIHGISEVGYPTVEVNQARIYRNQVRLNKKLDKILDILKKG